MPVSAMSFLCGRGLARSDHHQEELQAVCDAADVKMEDVIAETKTSPDLYSCP